MEYTIKKPCPSNLLYYSQSGNMWLLCGASVVKPLLLGYLETHRLVGIPLEGLRYLKIAEGCTIIGVS